MASVACRRFLAEAKAAEALARDLRRRRYLLQEGPGCSRLGSLSLKDLSVSDHVIYHAGHTVLQAFEFIMP